MADFVIDGENPDALRELAASQSHAAVGFDRFGASSGSENLATLVKLLPQDPSIYVRLASVYDAASRQRYAPQFSPMPGFGGGHRWLYVFLAELFNAAPKNTKILPASFVEAMIVVKEEEPSILVRGAMIVEDQQGKNQLCRWLPPPYNYFRPLSGFQEVAARYQGVVRQAPKEAEASEEPAEADATTVEEEDAGLSEPRGLAGGYTQRILGETIRRLDAISEAGCRLGLEAHRGWFDESRRGAYDSGLTSLAGALDSLADPSMFSPRVILQARYLVHLHMQAIGHAL